MLQNFLPSITTYLYDASHLAVPYYTKKVVRGISWTGAKSVCLTKTASLKARFSIAKFSISFLFYPFSYLLQFSIKAALICALFCYSFPPKWAVLLIFNFLFQCHVTKYTCERLPIILKKVKNII